MKITAKLLRGTILTFSLLLLIGATYSPARADEVTVSGTTSGVVSGVPPLTFTGNEFFTGTTALGIGSLSGANSLGSFFLTTAPTQALSGTFTLNITFSAPTGIAGGQGSSYVATIVGSVSPNLDQGGVNLHFNSPVQVFTFSNGVSTGSFSLTVADLFVQTGRTADLTAGITGQQGPAVPEPTTLLLLGSGITGIAAKLRQRKRAKDQQQS